MLVCAGSVLVFGCLARLVLTLEHFFTLCFFVGGPAAIVACNGEMRRKFGRETGERFSRISLAWRRRMLLLRKRRDKMVTPMAV